MFSRSKALAVALLTATLIAGMALGALGWARWSDGRREPGQRPPRERVSYTDRLEHHLQLSPAQRESVEVILQRQQAAMRTLWTEVGPRFDSLRAEIRSQIMTQLDSAQQVRFQELMTRGANRDQERRNGTRGSNEK
jgi:Heavy-metal resistance